MHTRILIALFTLASLSVQAQFPSTPRRPTVGTRPNVYREPATGKLMEIGRTGSAVPVLVDPGQTVRPLSRAQLRAASFTLAGLIPRVVNITGNGGGIFTYDSLSTAADNNGTVLVTGDGKRYTRVTNGEPINLKWFEAIGDGVADDTDEWRAFIHAYFAFDREEDYVVPDGNFRITDTTVIDITSFRSYRKHLKCRGRFTLSGFTGTSTFLTIQVRPNQLLSNVLIEGLNVVGGVSVLRLDGGASASSFLYRSKFTDFKFNGFSGRGLTLTGNGFESEFHNMVLEGTTNSVPLYVDATPASLGGGAISSMLFDGIYTTGGFRGVWAAGQSTDIRWKNITTLAAQQEGMFVEFGNNHTIEGHFEDNWRSVGSMASGGAGLTFNGHGAIINMLAGNGTQKYGGSYFSSGGGIIVIGGGQINGGMTALNYFRNSPTPNYTLMGTEDYTRDFEVPVNIIGAGGIMRTNALTPISNNFTAPAASMELDLNRGNGFTIPALTANSTITATTGRAPVDLEKLTVSVTQGSGTLYTLSWGAGFKRPPSLSVSFGETQVYTFTRTAGFWVYSGN